jgi:cobalt/nickel transport system ATP-binding protein
MSLPVLTCAGVGVHYPGREQPALSGVHLTLLSGQRLAVLGRNGSGKTSLLLVPTGLVPYTGWVEVAGMPVGPAHLGEVRRRLSVLFAVPEDQLLFPRVLDDVAFGLRSRPLREGNVTQNPDHRTANEIAHTWLERLGVAHLAGEATHRLSHGEKLRVALAGALAPGPDLLLLDEPSAALDPPARTALALLLAGLPATLLVATHDVSFAAEACTHWLLLREGRPEGPVRPISELPTDQDDLFGPASF